MRARRIRKTRAIIGAAVAIALLAGGRSVVTATMQSTAAPSCTRAEYHQFDFFIGDWDAYDVGSQKVKAHNVITRMLGGCAIREVYSRADGYVGESFSVYDSARATWHQSWVTNRGEVLSLDGGLRNGDMVLSGPTPGPKGMRATIRGIWHAQANGYVRETAEQSGDGGKTWTLVFDLEFRRRAAP
jgi:hypothetical protein